MRCRSRDRWGREALDGERSRDPHLTQVRAIHAQLEQEARERAPQSEIRRAAAKRGAAAQRARAAA